MGFFQKAQLGSDSSPTQVEQVETPIEQPRVQTILSLPLKVLTEVFGEMDVLPQIDRDELRLIFHKPAGVAGNNLLIETIAPTMACRYDISCYIGRNATVAKAFEDELYSLVLKSLIASALSNNETKLQQTIV